MWNVSRLIFRFDVEMLSSVCVRVCVYVCVCCYLERQMNRLMVDDEDALLTDWFY